MMQEVKRKTWATGFANFASANNGVTVVEGLKARVGHKDTRRWQEAIVVKLTTP